MLLVYLAVGWVAGIVIAGAIDPPWYALVLAGLVALAVGVFLRRDTRARVGAACLIAVVLGAVRLLHATPRFDEYSLASYNGQGRVAVEGVIVGEPDEREGYTELRLAAKSLAESDGTVHAVDGMALVRGPRYPRRQYGDRVIVEGRIETPHSAGVFSYQDYLARQGIHTVFDWSKSTLVAQGQASPVRRMLLRFKGRVREALAAVLPEPEASLLAGILLGVDSGIPRDLMDDFATTGTTHIIAISGFNLTIVAGVFAGLARRLVGRRRAFFVASASVAIYTVLVGASASVVRAAVMAFLFLWARYLGRSASAWVSLGAAAIVMTACNPHLLWDVGLQLSFAATLGLMAFTTPFEQALQWVSDRLGGSAQVDRAIGLSSAVLVPTLAATVTTMPLIVHHFGRLSAVTLLANAAILPVQPHAMIWGGLTAIGGLIAQPLGQAVAWVAWAFLRYTVGAVRLIAQIPHASIPVRISGGMVILYYGLLVCVTAWFALPAERRRDLRSRLTSRPWRSGLAVAGLVAVMVAAAWWRGRPDGRLHVVFLDVGQGDAIFVQTPSGRQVLIDGGPSESVLLDELGRQIPFWDRSLDVVVLTHPDLDHITGLLAVLERYQVDRIVYRAVDATTAEYNRWAALVVAEEADVLSGESGLRLDLEENVHLTVLYPGVQLDERGGAGHNNASVVIRVEYGAMSVLLPGDIEAEVERRLVADGAVLASTVVKLAHHGSCTSTTEEFLDAVSPELAVISVGENDYGHPCEAVLARLEEWAERRGRELPVYRTDRDGTADVVTDGAQVWVRTE